MEQNSMSGIRWKEKFCYGMGEVASGVTFGLVQSVLQKYYTDVLGLGVISIMLLFVLARFWDAANDTICGHVIARLQPDKTGRYRRWFKWFAVPLAACTFLMFLKIPGLSRTGYFIYACVTYILFGMVYTCLNVPYGSLAQAITIDSSERASLSVARSVGGVFGAIPALVLISFCYGKRPDGTKYMSYPIIITGVAIIAVLSMLLYIILYRGTRERIVEPSKEGKKGIFFKSMRALLTDRAFVVAAVAAMLYLASQQFSMSYSTYLFQYYFNAPGLTMLPTVFQYLPVAVMMFFVTKMGNRFGRREICAYGILAAGVGNLILFLMHTRNVWIYIVVLLISGVGTTFIYLLVWSIAADAIDHAALKAGVEEPYAYSFFSFMRKLGHCVAAVFVNLALFKIGYEGNVLNASNITDNTLTEMYTWSVLVPALLYLVVFVLLRFAYPLGKQAVLEQQKEKEARWKEK
ncbi:MAG: MFS transporter [Spirochaetales bacterium]|nr:MFS transporter [Spirochaetales bacterium]MBQ7282829.1 MFS transporter [Spirochaetales bacterium]MBR0520276.1 MFS transporter [Spirochaetales bacterium]